MLRKPTKVIFMTSNFQRR